MPIHDWTRVRAGTRHDFHAAWIAEIRTTLKSGLRGTVSVRRFQPSAG
jgi:hypothetical protein